MITAVLLPLLISIVVGLLLAAIVLRRARRVPLWVALVVGLGVADLASIPLAYIGLLVLRTSDAEWHERSSRGSERQPLAEQNCT